MLFVSLFQKASQPSAAQAVQGYDFPPPLGASQWVLYYIFSILFHSFPLGASQAREFQIATTTTPRKTVQTTFRTVTCIFSRKSSKSRVSWIVFPCFCNVFLQNTAIYTFVTIKAFQNIMFVQCFQFPCFRKPFENTAIYTVFFNFSMCQCRWPTQTYIQKIFQKHCFFFTVFLHCFPVKNTAIYTFFGIKSVQNTGFWWFLHCFQCPGIKNNFQFPYLPKPLKTPLFTLFSSIFPCANAAGQLKHIYKKSFKNIVFFYSVFTLFSRQKHRNLHVFRHQVGPKHWFLMVFSLFSMPWHQKQLSIPLSPQTFENTAIYTVFFNFSMCQCRWPTQTYIQKIFQKHCFFSVFTLFSVKNTAIYTFFGIKSVQNTGFWWFLHCFQCPGIKNNFQFPYLPKPLKNTAIYTVFFNSSMCQCRWPTQTYIQKILQKHCFFLTVFLHCFPVKKHRNLHVFRHQVGPKHWFLMVFAVCSMLWHPKNFRFPYLP